MWELWWIDNCSFDLLPRDDVEGYPYLSCDLRGFFVFEVDSICEVFENLGFTTYLFVSRAHRGLI